MLVDPYHQRRAGCFVLQWHLTHACDMSCAHCYDRTKIATLPQAQALRVLDDFEAFCRRRGVRGKLTLTGGNPFFYHSFFELCRAAAERDIPYAILGNPVPEAELDALVAIQTPEFFQISLEGLRAHNDEIRGSGVFDRAMAFLPRLRDRGIQSVVMVTLTRANMGQILPLADVLRDRVDRLTFNRLSQAGAGADLELPDPDSYREFLVDYAEARRTNPILGFKDGLFNIFRSWDDRPLLGGCTGHGCGAAFNFFALLPDGSAHACRKFPSPIGDAVEQGLDAVYDSPEAERYRRGCRACDGCGIRARCGGCLAVTAGQGGDPFRDVDPFCFARRGGIMRRPRWGDAPSQQRAQQSERDERLA